MYICSAKGFRYNTVWYWRTIICTLHKQQNWYNAKRFMLNWDCCQWRVERLTEENGPITIYWNQEDAFFQKSACSFKGSPISFIIFRTLTLNLSWKKAQPVPDSIMCQRPCKQKRNLAEKAQIKKSQTLMVSFMHLTGTHPDELRKVYCRVDIVLLSKRN